MTTSSTDAAPPQKRRREVRIPGDTLAAQVLAAHALPSEGYVRIWQIIGDRKASPPVPAVIPVCAATWWAGVKSGRFPKPIKLGPQTTVWRVEDIRALLESPAASDEELKAA